MIQPKALMVPFGYDGYPPELLTKFKAASTRHLRRLGIEVTTTPTIIDFKDARKLREKIAADPCEFVVVLVLSWLEAPNVIEAVRDLSHKPILLWSHTTWDEGDTTLTVGPIPGSTVLRQAFEELEWKFKFVYGQPGDKTLDEDMRVFAAAAHAYHQLRRSRIGLLGYMSMGMYSAAFDHLGLVRDWGPEVDQLDQYILIKRIGEMSDKEVAPLVAKARKQWKMTKMVRNKDLLITLKMYKVMRQLATERQWDCLSVKCQYELSKEFGYTPCVPLSMLGNEIPCSCEADIPLIAAQIGMRHLTDKIVAYGDIHTVEDDSLIMGACGFAPFDLGEGKPKVDRTTQLYEGLANCTVYKEGQITIARMGYRPDRKLKMHVMTGMAHTPRKFQEINCLPYPGMELSIPGLGKEFGQGMLSQHYAIVYGDIREELRELLRISDIEGVFVE
jgi:L-fucose isomerase-like protein